MKIFCTIGFLLIAVCVIAHPGVGIVMDSKGNVFYTDLKQVWKIDPKGKKSVVVRNVHTHELYMDEQDNLYGEHLWYNGEKLDTWGHYVWKYSADGKFEKIIPDREGFLTNYSFVRDKQGNMYEANRENKCQKVTRINTDGTLTILGDECLENIRWMTVTGDGIVYLVDLYDLKKIDQQGRVTLVASQLQDSDWLQFFTNDIHVYAAVQKGRAVKRVSPDGKVTVLTRTTAPWSPTGVLTASNGDLWILETSFTNAVRVERITADGKRMIY